MVVACWTSDLKVGGSRPEAHFSKLPITCRARKLFYVYNNVLQLSYKIFIDFES